MEALEKEYLDLLAKKTDILANVLRLTESENFFDEEKSITDKTERYSLLYEKRERMIAQAVALDSELTSKRYEKILPSNDNGFSESINHLKDKSAELIGSILKSDEKNQKAAQLFMDEIKTSIRNIKTNRSVNINYQTEIIVDRGVYFDKKN